MISIWHLFWIVPLTSFITLLAIALVQTSGEDDDKGVKPK
jgi:hypothetical protein